MKRKNIDRTVLSIRSYAFLYLVIICVAAILVSSYILYNEGSCSYIPTV